MHIIWRSRILAWLERFFGETTAPKPRHRFPRIACPVCARVLSVSKSGVIRRHKCGGIWR